MIVVIGFRLTWKYHYYLLHISPILAGGHTGIVPSSRKRTVAKFVVFTNTVESFNIAVCIGGLPVAEHVISSLTKARSTTGIDMTGGPFSEN